jgi:hypothetical protein
MADDAKGVATISSPGGNRMASRGRRRETAGLRGPCSRAESGVVSTVRMAHQGGGQKRFLTRHCAPIRLAPAQRPWGYCAMAPRIKGRRRVDSRPESYILLGLGNKKTRPKPGPRLAVESQTSVSAILPMQGKAPSMEASRMYSRRTLAPYEFSRFPARGESAPESAVGRRLGGEIG